MPRSKVMIEAKMIYPIPVRTCVRNPREAVIMKKTAEGMMTIYVTTSCMRRGRRKKVLAAVLICGHPLDLNFLYPIILL